MSIYVVFLGMWGAITFGTILLSILGKRKQVLRRQQSEQSRRTVQRDADYVTIVSEHDDGYGLAVADIDRGTEVWAFDGADEVYTDLWLRDDELSALADELSVKATQYQHTEQLQQ